MTALDTTLPIQQAQAQTASSSWRGLYKAGGFAALLSAVFFPIQVAVFLIIPPPSTVTGWFALFQNNRLAGLLDLDLLLVVDQVLAAVVFVALYVALRRASQSWMATGTALALLSTVLFIASNPAFAMLSLSEQYAAAETEAQQATFLAAGQAMLAIWQGSAFHVSYIVGSLGAVIISAVMLRSRHLGKSTAYMGILANVLALGLYVPRIGVYVSVFSVLFLWIWYILMARGLFRIADTAEQGASRPGAPGRRVT